jgi:hypothetical protein
LAAFFLLGQFWAGATNVLAIGIHRARRTGLLLPVFGLGALVNLALLFSLSRLVGIAAAGIGFMVGSIVSAYAACHYSNRHLSVPFSAPLLHWTLLATTVSAGAWYGLWLGFKIRQRYTPPSPHCREAWRVASLVAVVWRSSSRVAPPQCGVRSSSHSELRDAMSTALALLFLAAFLWH